MPADPNVSATGTLEQARAHARAQAAGATATTATIPSTAAVDLPTGVDHRDVLWDETVPLGGYAAVRVPRDGHVRLTDLGGDANIGLLVFNAGNTAERSNVADTVKVQWQAYLGEGAVVLSDMGRALATIVSDTSGRHDALCGTTTRPANERRYGHGAIHGTSPAGRELFIVAAAKNGLAPHDLPPSLNLFKGVRVHDDGGLELLGAPRPGAHVELRADLDVLVLIVNAPHPLDLRPEYLGNAVRVTAWQAPPPSDRVATAATPERARSYENTAQYLRGRS
jgi:urea carboxylase-associated protein 2